MGASGDVEQHDEQEDGEDPPRQTDGGHAALRGHLVELAATFRHRIDQRTQGLVLGLLQLHAADHVEVLLQQEPTNNT